MKKKLIVHVGYSKCGSTTIQDTLAANYSCLMERGVMFPKVLSSSPSWLRFFWEKELPVTYSKEKVSKKFQVFSKALRDEVGGASASTIILSDEGLISLSEESVKEFQEFLGHEFPDFEIHIVIIVRARVSFFTSRCQQFISDRYFDKIGIQEFIEGRSVTTGESRADTKAMNPVSFYSKPISMYDKLFDRVHVLKFEEAILDSRGLTSYFLKSCGLDHALEDIRKNESRSRKAIELIAYINNKLPFLRHSSGKQLRHYHDLEDLYLIVGDKFKLPNILASEIHQKTSKEVNWLKARCGIDYTDHLRFERDESIVFDDVFFQNVVDLFPQQGLAVQVAILQFAREGYAMQWNSVSSENLKKLQNWIEGRYPFRSRISISTASKLMLFDKYYISRAFNIIRRYLRKMGLVAR